MKWVNIQGMYDKTKFRICKQYAKVGCSKKLYLRNLIKIHSISPYSVQMGENTDQNKSENEHFSRSGSLPKT